VTYCGYAPFYGNCIADGGHGGNHNTNNYDTSHNGNGGRGGSVGYFGDEGPFVIKCVYAYSALSHCLVNGGRGGSDNLNNRGSSENGNGGGGTLIAWAHMLLGPAQANGGNGGSGNHVNFNSPDGNGGRGGGVFLPGEANGGFVPQIRSNNTKRTHDSQMVLVRKDVNQI
jgi:hypothetical protein